MNLRLGGGTFALAIACLWGSDLGWASVGQGPAAVAVEVRMSTVP